MVEYFPDLLTFLILIYSRAPELTDTLFHGMVLILLCLNTSEAAAAAIVSAGPSQTNADSDALNSISVFDADVDAAPGPTSCAVVATCAAATVNTSGLVSPMHVAVRLWGGGGF